MALREKLDEDLKSAMRAKDSLRMNTVRALKSAVKYREIELMKPLDDAGILGVMATEIKRRRDSVEQYRAGNRADLADKEEAEIKHPPGVPAPAAHPGRGRGQGGARPSPRWGRRGRRTWGRS